MIDLPFGTPAGTTTNGVAFGEEKAQAFLQWNTEVLQTKFGQFDTIFGVEQNDSKDRFFADAGLVKSNIIPLTHTGALVGAGFSNFMIRGLIADPRNTSTQTNTNLEFGVQGRFDMAPFYVAAGALYNQAKVANERTNLLIDVMGGFRAETFRIDAFYDNNKVAGVDDASNSLGVLGTFDLSPGFGLGGRLEWASDINFGGNQADAFEITAGPSFKVLPEITLRGDVTFADVDFADTTGLEDRSVFGLNVSAVALF
jgi:Putative beta-barrel porin-2, OmpL-like. bbp2